MKGERACQDVDDVGLPRFFGLTLGSRIRKANFITTFSGGTRLKIPMVSKMQFLLKVLTPVVIIFVQGI